MYATVTRIAAAAAIALAALPIVAVGAAHAETRTVTIGVSDLDFARPADVARFETRVNHAAYRICPKPVQVGLRAAAACHADVDRQARAKLGAEQHRRMAIAKAGAAGFETAAN